MDASEVDWRDRTARKTVVVIDRDPEILRLLRRMLEDERYRALRRVYRVVVCQGTDPAPALIGETLPDAVILDVPTGDVAEAQIVDALKRDPRTARIPVLVCAAPSRELQEQQAGLREQGCELLLKPFGTNQLLETVRGIAG